VRRIEGFSAHVDWKAVPRWLEGLRQNTPQTTVLQHTAKPDAAEAMVTSGRKDWLGTSASQPWRNNRNYREWQRTAARARVNKYFCAAAQIPQSGVIYFSKEQRKRQNL